MATQYNYSDNAARKYDVVRQGGFSGLGQRYVMIRCPFCGTESKAYIWSISGGGKLCENKKACGAKFASFGNAYPVVGREDMTP